MLVELLKWLLVLRAMLLAQWLKQIQMVLPIWPLQLLKQFLALLAQLLVQLPKLILLLLQMLQVR